jgi:type VI secretion system protein ImpJ
MKSPQRVVWSEGLLVSPQHLQQTDLYHERLLDARLAAALPFSWGVTQVGIDPGALGAEMVKLSSFVGALPDGLFLSFDGGDPECPQARPIQGHFPPTQPALEVYVGAVKEREGVPSVMGEGAAIPNGGDPRSVRTRFRSFSRQITDLSGTAEDLVIPFAERNVVLLFGDEARTDFDTVKVAEIVRDTAGRLVVNDTYIPPVLRIEASPFIMESVRRTLGLMAAKQRQLSEERRQRDPATVEFNMRDITRFLQLNTVNSAVGVLTELARGGDISAKQLYLYLVEWTGQLATFSADEDPTKFPAFVYTDLRSTFEEIFARLTSLLQATARAAHMPVPLEISQGLHIGKLTDKHVGLCHQYVLAVRSDMPEEAITQRLPGITKIASYNQLPYILRSATPGVPLRVVHRPPPEIPIRPGLVYFMLEVQSDHWRPVLEERTISIYLPAPFDPSKVKLELYGIPRPVAQSQ